LLQAKNGNIDRDIHTEVSIKTVGILVDPTDVCVNGKKQSAGSSGALLVTLFR